MTDNKEGEQTASSGNGQGSEWEVVTLTASAYAADLGNVAVQPVNEEGKGVNTAGRADTETSNALFMSGHFAFPPSEHENLPIQPDDNDTHKKDKEADTGAADLFSEEGGPSHKKGEENWYIEGLNDPEYPSMHDDSGNKLDFDEAMAALHGLDVTDIAKGVYSSPKFSSFHAGANMDAEELYDDDESTGPIILPDPSDVVLDPSGRPYSLSNAAEDAHNTPELPPGAWWKRQVASLCAHVKETNAFWSVFLAAAVMGLVLLGQQWQQERWQVLQHRWQLSVNAEKPGKMLGPLSRFKDIIVGGSRRASYINNGARAEL